MSTTYAGKSVAIVSSNYFSPITIQATSHGYLTGDKVSISGHTVNTTANGEWTITKVDANYFTLTGSSGIDTGGATGTVTAFVGSVTMLDDGETDNASGRDPSLQGLADRTQLLYRDYKARLAGHFAVQSVSITRVVQSTPYAPAAYWVCNSSPFDGSVPLFTSATPSRSLVIPVSLPHGAIWTGFTAYVNGAASPATPININSASIDLLTGAESSVLGFVNDSPSTGKHAVTLSGGPAVIDNTRFLYALLVVSESGAGAGTSGFWGATITYKVPALDIGGA